MESITLVQHRDPARFALRRSQVGEGAVRIVDWNPRTCTTDSAEVFCVNCELVERVGEVKTYRCLGHGVLGQDSVAMALAETGQNGRAVKRRGP